jgi:mannan endo-1,4-beta-mannosidase
MRFGKALLFSLAGTLPTLVVTSPHGREDIPRAVGRHFEIDGKVQYFAGTNCWWLGNLVNDFEVEQAISEIADVRATVAQIIYANTDRLTSSLGLDWV